VRVWWKDIQSISLSEAEGEAETYENAQTEGLLLSGADENDHSNTSENRGRTYVFRLAVHTDTTTLAITEFGGCNTKTVPQQKTHEGRRF
jgi:hypothetical protein